MDKIKAILKNKEIIMYLVFGVLTTIVNYIIYFGCTKALNLNWFLANGISWVAAVTFAYITNRIWVFESKASGFWAIGREIILFVGCRIVSLGFDMGTMYICMDCFYMGNIRWEFVWWGVEIAVPIGEFIAKTIAQVIVVVSNYIFSKWIIFKKTSER